MSALGALLTLAVVAVPSPATAADSGASAGQERLKEAARNLVAEYEGGAGPAHDGGERSGAPSDGETVRGAEVRSSGDAIGDVPYCGGDLASFKVDFNANINVSAVTSCSSNPATSDNWKIGDTAIGWFFDHSNNGSLDYVVVYMNDGSDVVAAVYRLSDETLQCEGPGAWDGNKTYSASFAPSCFGNPTTTYAGVLMTWDENPLGASCTCPTDAAPEVEMLGPIHKGLPPAPGTGGSGYWMVGASGIVYSFGDARHYGNANVAQFGPDVIAIDIESRPNDNAGYWIVDTAGHVYSFGSAPWYGNAALHSGEVATSIASTKTGKGYYVFTDRGRALTFGDAVHRGDMSGVPLNGPVLDSTLNGAGNGYYMVGSDGGIFSFNSAFYGSMGGQPLNQPVLGMAGDPDAVGYWLVAADGGIFAFHAKFNGSMGGQPLNKPVIGMVAYGDGYLMVASDGGIFNFSTKPFRGSLGANPPAIPIVSVAPIR